MAILHSGDPIEFYIKVGKIDREQKEKPSKLSHGLPLWLSWYKVSACNAGNLGSIPGLGRYPGEGEGYPLQYSGLENSMDYTVHGVAKSRRRLSDFHFTSVHFTSKSPIRPKLVDWILMKTKVKDIRGYKIEIKVYKIDIFKWGSHKPINKGLFNKPHK